MINILIPTDFSANASKACRIAISQFDLSNTNFILCHAVVQPRSYSGMLVNITDIMMNDAIDNLNTEIEELKSTFGLELRISHRTKLGYLTDIIEGCVRNELIDLIAMGTKGESNLASKVVGSNAEQVIRKSVVPVLAIPFESEVLACRKILIAYDKEVFLKAEVLQKILGSFKSLVDVSAVTVLTSPEQRAMKSMDLHGRFIPVAAIKNDNAIDGIHEHLSAEPADLLVVYHSKNTRLDYLFSRSITKKLAGSMPLPLLIIPG